MHTQKPNAGEQAEHFVKLLHEAKNFSIWHVYVILTSESIISKAINRRSFCFLLGLFFFINDKTNTNKCTSFVLFLTNQIDLCEYFSISQHHSLWGRKHP
jgi:hypothetical protein